MFDAIPFALFHPLLSAVLPSAASIGIGERLAVSLKDYDLSKSCFFKKEEDIWMKPYYDDRSKKNDCCFYIDKV